MPAHRLAYHRSIRPRTGTALLLEANPFLWEVMDRQSATSFPVSHRIPLRSRLGRIRSITRRMGLWFSFLRIVVWDSRR